MELHTFLPDIVILSQETWGVHLTALELLPLTFFLLTCVFLVLVPFLPIHGEARPVFLLRWGIVGGSVLLFAGSVCQWLGLVSAQAEGSISQVGLFIISAGLLLLGVALFWTLHSIYDAAC